MLDDVAAMGDAERYVKELLDRGERLMGFGHRVYRAEDPRARVLRRTAKQLGAPRVEVAEALENAALAELQARRPDRVLATNVEFWSAVVLDFAEVPPELFTPMFTCARTAGWSAHILEQKREGRLIRPTAKYVGPGPRPLSEADRELDRVVRPGCRPGPYSGQGPHDSRTSARSGGARRSHRSAVPRRLEPLRLARGGRGPRPGDVRPRPAQAAAAALRGRPRLPAAGACATRSSASGGPPRAGLRRRRCRTIST